MKVRIEFYNTRIMPGAAIASLDTEIGDAADIVVLERFLKLILKPTYIFTLKELPE